METETKFTEHTTQITKKVFNCEWFEFGVATSDDGNGGGNSLITCVFFECISINNESGIKRVEFTIIGTCEREMLSDAFLSLSKMVKELP